MPFEPRRPEFREPIAVPESIEDDRTGFELPPDPAALAEVARGPFRPDWERARAAALLAFES